MPDNSRPCHHIKFTAPSGTQPAGWGVSTGAFWPVPREPDGKPRPVTTSGPDAIGLYRPFVALIEVDVGHAATIIVTSGNWPKGCAKAIQLELEGSFNDLRDEVGLTGYIDQVTSNEGSPSPEPDLSAARRVTIKCSAAGLLTVSSYLTSLSIDLTEMSSPSITHTHHVVVLPGLKKLENGKTTPSVVRIYVNDALQETLNG